jgi:hypothetical protein
MRRERITLTCAQCNQPFEVIPFYAEINRFCARACYHAWRAANNVHRIPVEDRFWGKVDKHGPIPVHCPDLGRCWVWTSKNVVGGYGRFHVSRTRRGVLAHRYAYELAHGGIDAPLDCCHKCDNTLCVNPAHLFLGTTSDNMTDAVKKGRKVPPRGFRLTADDVHCIIALREQGVGPAELARRYHVSSGCISGIFRGTSWRHVTGLT